MICFAPVRSHRRSARRSGEGDSPLAPTLVLPTDAMEAAAALLRLLVAL